MDHGCRDIVSTSFEPALGSWHAGLHSPAGRVVGVSCLLKERMPFLLLKMYITDQFLLLGFCGVLL